MFSTLQKIISGLLVIAGITFSQSLMAQIPAQLISPNVYTLHKLSNNNSIIFDSTTPYVEYLVIVDSNGEPCPSILANYNSTINKKTFDFSLTPNGIYYAKGLVTGSGIFYKINVID